MYVKLFLKDLNPTFIPHTPQALNTYRVTITLKLCSSGEIFGWVFVSECLKQISQGIININF